MAALRNCSGDCSVTVTGKVEPLLCRWSYASMYMRSSSVPNALSISAMFSLNLTLGLGLWFIDPNWRNCIQMTIYKMTKTLTVNLKRSYLKVTWEMPTVSVKTSCLNGGLVYLKCQGFWATRPWMSYMDRTSLLWIFTGKAIGNSSSSMLPTCGAFSTFALWHDLLDYPTECLWYLIPSFGFHSWKGCCSSVLWHSSHWRLEATTAPPVLRKICANGPFGWTPS